MTTHWQYILPERPMGDDYPYEGPIYSAGERAFWITTEKQGLTAHILSAKSGAGKQQILVRRGIVLPHNCFFIEQSGKLLLYAGDLYVYDAVQDSFRTVVRLSDQGKLRAHLHCSDRLFLLLTHAQERQATLYCYTLQAESLLWQTDVSAPDCPYSPGALWMHGHRLTAFGQGRLLWINPDSGKVEDSLTLPRIGKLYRPIPDGGKLLLGYTNWSSAGVLCTDGQSRKVLWKNSLQFEGPELREYVGLCGNILVWSKNDRELVAVDVTDGKTLYRKRTAPWLYTNPQMLGIACSTAPPGAADSWFVWRWPTAPIAGPWICLTDAPIMPSTMRAFSWAILPARSCRSPLQTARSCKGIAREAV